MNDSPSYKRKKILLTDDYPLNLELAKDLLEMMDCEVTPCKSGDEAVEKFQEGEFDLVLMDIQMPGQNGYETTEKLRNVENPLKRVPIIALSANTSQEDYDHCIASGMDALLGKPIDTKALEEILNKYIQ